MDAASSQQLRGRGAPTLLRHCAALERITSTDVPSARARLEDELGAELADLLVGALAAHAGRRTAFALL
jgi:hypothetical protein